MSNTITEVRLLAVPLENDYAHTLYFASASAQATYFQSRTVKDRSNFSYQRKDKIIRYPEHVDKLLGCNYVMYKNSEFSSKWYYAFITKMEYINDERTDIYIETDVIQTWLFDYNVKASFVEREHVDDDTIGLHTVPEQVETGEYVCKHKNRCEQLNVKMYVIASTVDLEGADEEGGSPSFANVSGKSYGKIYSGVRYYGYTSSEDVNNVLKNIANAGKSDAITSIFIVPVSFMQTSGHEINGVSDGELWGTMTDGNTTVQTKNFKPEFLDNNYIPRNRKLFTFPYTYLLMSNNAGGCAVYHYEKFNKDDPLNDTCDFKLYGALTPSFSCRLVPQNYNGVANNNEEGLTMCKLPICNWNTDVFTNWLTQNGVNIAIQTGTAIASVAGGIALSATGGGALVGGGMVVGGLTSIANSLGQIHQHSFTPPQAEGNLNSGDATYSMGDATFTAYQMTIKEEYAKIIDGYFDMFGYKVNRLKVPNKNHRISYWYTKTIDANIDGNIPMDDLRKIKDCYNRGITFWKSPSNIGDYSVSNTIVGYNP